MGRRVRIVIVAVLLTLLLAGCAQEKSTEISTENISVGVIETSGNQKKSRILFFDTEMREVGELPLKFATVGNIFYNPLVWENKLYVIPQGYANQKDEKAVLEIALENLDVETYTINQLAMNSVAANGEFIYTCNTVNGSSYINKCDTENNKTESIEIPKVYLSKLLCSGERIYAFGTEYVKNGAALSYLYVYDDQLNLQEKIDISQCGTDQYKAIEYHGSIYFTNLADSKDQPTKIVGKMNTSDYSIERIELNQYYPLDLAIYDNKLFISHFDLVRRTGGGLSIYDLDTKQQENYELNHGAEQMAIANGKLYVLADWKIYVYHADTMELIQSVDITQMGRDYSYLSGMFTVERAT